MGWGKPPKGPWRTAISKPTPRWLGVLAVLTALGATGLAAWAVFELATPKERVYPHARNAGGKVELRVPPPFRSWGVRNHQDKNSMVWIQGEARDWARRAEEIGCEGDLETFVAESERVRSDLSLQITFTASKWIDTTFENYKSGGGGRAVETSIVDWNGDDPKHPRQFAIDMTDRLGTDALSYADCYYSNMPHWYCNIDARLTPKRPAASDCPRDLPIPGPIISRSCVASPKK